MVFVWFFVVLVLRINSKVLLKLGKIPFCGSVSFF